MADRIETDLQVIQDQINKAKHSNTRDQYLKTIDFLFIEILKHKLKYGYTRRNAQKIK